MSTPITDAPPAGHGGRRLPLVLRGPAELRLEAERWSAAGMAVGMVPTMGALHDGHRSLIRRARAECDRVVVSIFVNPRQFGPGEDFERYPRSLDSDMGMLLEEGVHAAYVPTVEALYPPGFASSVRVGGRMGQALEGASRPGHLDGVALVVVKLLVACRCTRAYFGAKDAQQCAVVRRVIADLDLGTAIVVCPTVRDADGLALSSRNAYLTAAQRRQALAIPAALAEAARRFDQGVRTTGELTEIMRERLARAQELTVDYAAVVDPDSFDEITEARRGSRAVIAAKIGTTRLIDTACLGVDAPPVSDADAGAPAGRDLSPGRTDRSGTCTVR